jgi:hypothetical protein
VTAKITGTDATRFSIPAAATSISVADASAGYPVSVSYTPSTVKEGIHDAQLELSSPGAASVYINLVGSTTGGTPEITTPKSGITLWTSLIAEKSTNVNISGVGLNGPVSISIQGAGASRFSVDASSVSLTDASVGKDIKLTYVGTISVGETAAELVLTSTGAAEVRIPLKGVTLEQRPKLYSLTFEVSPAGSAYVETDIAGPSYLDGSTVKATVTPESNKKVSYWSDAAGNSRVERTFTVGEYKNGVITVFMVDGQQSGGGGDTSTGGLTGLVPTNVQETGFDVTWTSVVGATSYTVKVYDQSGTILQTLSNLTGTSTTITGLSAGTYYKYSVETTVNSTASNTGLLGPFKTAGTSVNYNCGQ